jgi:peptidoglycan/xylan/chitin deacetylase (PgdA/CDA1 family)
MARRSLLSLVASLAFLLPAAPRGAIAADPLGSLGLEALALPSASELGLEPSLEPSLEPVSAEPVVAPPTCIEPEPRSRWADRASDDDWIPGLYPARERYADGTLALTFDDGPHKTRTPIALAELARRDMHATFFLTGHAIRKNSYALVQQMVREGHTLANHGWRHDTRMASQLTTTAELEAYVTSEFELTQIRVDLAMLASSPEDFAAMDREVFAGLSWAKHDREVQLAAMPQLRARHRALLESRGYSETDRPVTLEWLRPPGGNPYLGSRWTPEERDAFARAVNAMGMRMVMWSGGSGDSDTNLTPAERRDPERVAEAARKAARRGGIFVAHDRIEPAALRAMLSAVAASDVEVVSLAQLRAAKLGCE